MTTINSTENEAGRTLCEPSIDTCSAKKTAVFERNCVVSHLLKNHAHKHHSQEEKFDLNLKCKNLQTSVSKWRDNLGAVWKFEIHFNFQIQIERRVPKPKQLQLWQLSRNWNERKTSSTATGNCIVGHKKNWAKQTNTTTHKKKSNNAAKCEFRRFSWPSESLERYKNTKKKISNWRRDFTTALLGTNLQNTQAVFFDSSVRPTVMSEATLNRWERHASDPWKPDRVVQRPETALVTKENRKQRGLSATAAAPSSEGDKDQSSGRNQLHTRSFVGWDSEKGLDACLPFLSSAKVSRCTSWALRQRALSDRLHVVRVLW